jgi:hypothetical protein
MQRECCSGRFHSKCAHSSQCMAQVLTLHLRLRRQQKFRVSFLPVSVMLLEERQMQLCCVEPMMRGDYVKHNDNDGHVETHEQLPQVGCGQ